MLQIQRVFSPPIRNREPFATGWWRKGEQLETSVIQRAQASWMRFSAPFGNVDKTCSIYASVQVRQNPPRICGYVCGSKFESQLVRLLMVSRTCGTRSGGQPWTPIRAQTTHQFRPYRVPFAYRALPTPLTRFWLRPRRPESLRGWQASDEG